MAAKDRARSIVWA